MRKNRAFQTFFLRKTTNFELKIELFFPVENEIKTKTFVFKRQVKFKVFFSIFPHCYIVDLSH